MPEENDDLKEIQEKINLNNLNIKVSENKQQVTQFAEILSSIETLDEKKRFLWKQIYENAINDRALANILYVDLWLQSQGVKAEHEKSGPILAKYLERMAKSNDQLLKLAELLEEAEKIHNVIDENDIFNQIDGNIKK